MYVINTEDNSFLPIREDNNICKRHKDQLTGSIGLLRDNLRSTFLHSLQMIQTKKIYKNSNNAC